MSVYTNMLYQGMKARGHDCDIWKPKARFYNLPVPKHFKKWMGYLDQLIIFPISVSLRISIFKKKRLFVFVDSALGPWVPLVYNLPHVIHCHDFIAMDSAKGLINENRLNFTGRIYQKYILNGLKKGKNFISVSSATKQKLETLITCTPVLSEVVFNGINKIFKPIDSKLLRQKLTNQFNINLNDGFIMHVGGNLWYKNRRGVIAIYNQWRVISDKCFPLILIGEPADQEISRLIESMEFKSEIHILNGIDDNTIHEFYVCADLLIFPSFMEGFGWPIVEAMACGCPVVTTNMAPMTEIGGKAAFYIQKCPEDRTMVNNWINEAAVLIESIYNKSAQERSIIAENAIINSSRFNLDINLDKIEAIYKKVLCGI